MNTIEKKSENVRYRLVDHWRAVAIILMIFFHFCFDLDVFGHIDIDVQEDLFWWFLPRLIVFMFMMAVGISLRLVHKNGLRLRKFWPRFVQLIFFAMTITITTYFMFPKSWVYFGTLHCIAVCSALALPFIQRPKLSGALGLLITIPALFGFNYPFPKMAHISMDYIPVLPWFGYVLLGIFIESKNWDKISYPRFKGDRILDFMGAHGLFIYVIHQPIMYGLIYGFYLLHRG
ncbi:PF07786 family protein [Bacteriovorax sp. BSW11_IV]|uniref:heparan-alpha-glucosaminide N-acetyltransferase n=1 Tax=Bacteriovorax sp. BSW11_IV TaxID=1353529 RepID=UPI000389DCC3|nr:heparan-alpha-glucosaminide N-acetyltransferase [Bacteriovorax sp. BSW11_IV]EQC47645.1 PF07786 family protein [Bacteriovorax sp. BSW11_IV]